MKRAYFLLCLSILLLTSSRVSARAQKQRQERAFPQTGTTQTSPPDRDRVPDRPEVVQEERRRIWSPSFGVTLDLGSPCGGGQEDPEKTLASKGPIFAPVFSMSNLSVQGFVKGNWPMVLEYEMEPGALGLLTVTSDGVEPFFYRLDGSKRGRQQEILRLPPRFGDKPKIGWYLVRAMSDGPGEARPVYIRVFGLGAGERAVGSVGIDQLRFQPGKIRPAQKEKASYSFHSRSDFNKVSAEFLSVGLFKGQVVANLVDDDEVGDVRRDQTVSNRSWDGKAGKVNKELKGKPSLGQHVLQVRAWMGSKSAGDWVIAWSPELVRVE